MKPHLATFAVMGVAGGATAVIADSIISSSNYTACGLVNLLSFNAQILEILNSGNISLTSSKTSLILLALVPTN